MIEKERNNKKLRFLAIFIVAIILAGLIFDLSKLLIFIKIKDTGKIYSGYSLEQPDSVVFMPAWRDILDGHWWSSDGMTYEYANAPFLWTNPPNILLLAPLIFLLQDVNYLFVVGYFLAGVILFFTFFLTLNIIIKNRIYSMIGSLVFVSASNIFYIVFPFTWEQIKLAVRTFSFFGDPPVQILANRYESLSMLPGYAPFCLTFLFIYLAIIKRGWFWVILSGLLSGSLLYLFPTSAMYIWTSLGIMMLGFICIKELRLAKNFFWILIIAISSSFLYWFNYLSLKFLPWSKEIFEVLGGEFGFSFRLGWHILEYAIYILFSVIIWRLAKQKKDKKTAIYLIAFLIAPIFLLNIQVILGFAPFPHAWYVHQFYYGFALCWLVSIYWLYELRIKKNNFFKKIIIITGIILALIIFVQAVRCNIHTSNLYYKGNYIEKNRYDALKWLENNTKVDSVVVSPSSTTNVLNTIFSHNRVILPNTINFVGPLNELLDRWMVVCALYQISAEKFEHTILKEKGYIYNSYFRDKKLGNCFYRDLQIIEEEIRRAISAIEKNVEDYKNYPRRLEYLLSRYKMNYFYVGPDERAIMGSGADIFDECAWLEKVYDEGEIKIYRILQENGNTI